ncbi:DUF2141 domain-containing protein [uncultured Algimonas sp.]|uniref:DUF2141 domain-containing protein n=1 Tax=uncultured Algimonas sp. TaxID=1547920 RepID=UPI00260BB8FD|nr:DUF2141 domain-containing protein [uncultured Algimonas sp.]
MSVPITVTFNDVRAGDVPFYVSIQTEGEYRSPQGHGDVLEATEAGSFTRTFMLPAAGDYAVSVWHDLDADRQFTMGPDYKVEDGWGTSGDPALDTMPTFSDVKVSVSGEDTAIEIDMVYPED